MYRSYNKQFKSSMVIIQPGEFYISNSEESIATVLGSCIAVCLYDTKNLIGGMNHFMLPGDFRDEDIFKSKSGRYGMFAMEKLINAMLKKGGKKENFIAKVFGGAHVLNFRKTDGNIPDANISFVKTYLAFEEIKIISSDLGGNIGRKIIFFPKNNGKVLVKKLSKTEDASFISQEKEYKSVIFKKEKGDLSGGVTIFKND